MDNIPNKYERDINFKRILFSFIQKINNESNPFNNIEGFIYVRNFVKRI